MSVDKRIKLNATSNQDAFNKSYRGVVGQGRASIDGGGSTESGEDSCMYRGKIGCRCGIGWLIDDVDYNKAIEGHDLKSWIRKGPGFKIDSSVRLDLLTRLQQAHDMTHENYGNVDRDKAQFIPEFIRRMTILAKDFNLEIPQ